MSKDLMCSKCKEVVTSCDSGWGHHLSLGDDVICKKKPRPQGSLHFCDQDEMIESIADPDIPVRTYGINAKVVYYKKR